VSVYERTGEEKLITKDQAISRKYIDIMSSSTKTAMNLNVNDQGSQLSYSSYSSRSLQCKCLILEIGETCDYCQFMSKKEAKLRENEEKIKQITPTISVATQMTDNNDDEDDEISIVVSKFHSSKEKKKEKKKKKKTSTTTKPSAKLQFINGKREHNENLLKIHRLKDDILKYLWMMVTQVWKCHSDKSLEQVQELWDRSRLLPFPFLEEPEKKQPQVMIASDLRGKLDWKIIDPVDNYTIDVYLIHSLGTPILKCIKVQPNHRALIITDNWSCKDFPKDTIILSTKQFMYDYSKQHYISEHIRLEDSEIIRVLRRYDCDVNRYPLINDKDPALLYFFGFHCPKMVNIPRPSVTAGVTPYYRFVSNLRPPIGEL
jgi:DNA-directed RNA polymerase subunit H (RpoH/RPB5)